MGAAPRFTNDTQNGPSPSELVSGLRRRLPTIVAAGLVGVVAALIVSSMQPSRYTSTASILIETADDSALTQRVNMATEKQIASSTALADAVIHALRLDAPTDEVLDGLAVTVPVDAEVLVLSYTANDPAKAKRLAQAFSDAYLNYRRTARLETLDASTEAIQERIEELRAQLQAMTTQAASRSDPGTRAALQAASNSVLTQISIQEQQLASTAEDRTPAVRQLVAASLPTSPSGPKIVVNSILGLFVGVVFGTFIALSSARLPMAQTEGELADVLGAPVLAVIPRSRRAERTHPVVVDRRDSPAADAYRRLAVELSASPDDTSVALRNRTIAVVGLDDRSDTAIAVANVGAAMALSGQSVILVSAASDGTTLEEIFRTPLRPGIGSVIRNEARLNRAIRSTTFPSLSLVPAGSDEERWALLDTAAVRRTIDRMASTADTVIVNAPARATGETIALVAACGVVLFVGSSRSVPLEEARRARVDLEVLGARCAGIVVDGERLRHGRPRRSESVDVDLSDRTVPRWPQVPNGTPEWGTPSSSPAATPPGR